MSKWLLYRESKRKIKLLNLNAAISININKFIIDFYGDFLTVTTECESINNENINRCICILFIDGSKENIIYGCKEKVYNNFFNINEFLKDNSRSFLELQEEEEDEKDRKAQSSN